MLVNQTLSPNFTCPANLTVNLSSSANNNASSRFLNDKRVFDENDYQLPFPLFFDNSSATCMDAPTMGYPWDIQMWDRGLMDAWNTAREPGYGMAFFESETQLPFYYALVNAFTLGD